MVKDMRRLSFVLAVGLTVGATQAQAQDKFPSKPIKIVVPFGPGSATDIVIRIVG
jgi:tripartite-type tricarboxylate transporter receptor subunit TctC